MSVYACFFLYLFCLSASEKPKSLVCTRKYVNVLTVKKKNEKRVYGLSFSYWPTCKCTVNARVAAYVNEHSVFE